MWRRRRVHLGDEEAIVPGDWEAKLGKFAGFALVIHAKKPLGSKPRDVR